MPRFPPLRPSAEARQDGIIYQIKGGILVIQLEKNRFFWGDHFGMQFSRTDLFILEEFLQFSFFNEINESCGNYVALVI